MNSLVVAHAQSVLLDGAIDVREGLILGHVRDAHYPGTDRFNSLVVCQDNFGRRVKFANGPGVRLAFFQYQNLVGGDADIACLRRHADACWTGAYDYHFEHQFGSPPDEISQAMVIYRKPPLASRCSPVSQREASEARNTMTSAISSGRPVRPSGV